MFREKSYQRLVLKIGSTLLVGNGAGGKVNETWLRSLAVDIAEARSDGTEIVVVSSGAIALGRAELGLAGEAGRLDEQQAAAAIGQIRLANSWHGILAEHDIVAAQVLLTIDETEHRRRYLNARDTMTTLLARHAIPVVNENDTVATDEIRYGDNDRLAARVAQMLGADALVLLSSVDGLYTGSPSEAESVLVNEVSEITPQIVAMAQHELSEHGTGGMAAKIAAAKIAVAAGCDMFVADGRIEHPLRALRSGARCTRFSSAGSPQAARKRWIAGSLRIAGSVKLDSGALAALKGGKSLLPVGVTMVYGDFRRGDTVAIVDANDVEVARGLCTYDSDEAHRIIGKNSSEIESVLGYKGPSVLVHRNDLAWTNGTAADSAQVLGAGG